MTHDADRTPDEIRRWLADIADMAALLPLALIAGPSRSDVNTRRPVPSSKPLANIDLLSLTADANHLGDMWERGMQYVDPDGAGVLPYLWGWVRDVEATMYDDDQQPDEPPADPTVTECCNWLSRYADAASKMLQWPEIAYGLRNLRGELLRATSGIREVEAKPVPCSICGLPLERVGEQALWRCGTGHEKTVEAVTLRQASERVGVPLSTLKRWSLREGLMPRLRESERRTLYDLGSIRRLAVEARLRGAG